MNEPGDLVVEVLRELGPERARAEADLDAAGVPLPLPHRIEWARYRAPATSWFLAVREGDGRCVAGFALEVARMRVLPGHLRLTAVRVGPSLPGRTRGPALRALCDLVRGSAFTLDARLSIFAREEADRAELARELAAHGFRRSTRSLHYTTTAILDLHPPIDALHSALPAATRRKLRQAGRAPVEIRALTDPAAIPRMQVLFDETLRRTGGSYAPPPWEALLALANRPDARTRIVGLFRTDGAGPEALLAFGTAFFHGDCAHYDVSASTRETDLKVPMLYPILWDLIAWAQRRGASFFDFGGISSGGRDSDDPLGGISDFKRQFAPEERVVAEDWSFEPRPWRSRLAAALQSALARRRAPSKETP